MVSASCLGDISVKHPYSVYVVPQFSATEIHTAWAPLLEKVGIQTKQCYNLIIPGTIPEFEKAIVAGKADYAYMNPYHEVMAYRAQKYMPLLADGSKMLSGIVVVKSDSPIKTLADLRNATIAFPAPNAFGASLLIRATLSKAGIPFRAEFVKSHSNVYRSVIFGDYQAGGGIQATLQHERPEVKEHLRVVYTTGAYKPHPIAVNPRISLSDASAFTDAILGLKQDPSGRQLLEGIQISDPVKVSYQKDYQSLESLGLSKFVVLDAN
ncbi:phosphate/phosphite/phosphonate ABC transporter substrate-binding protein [Polynucleobacter necessarius]|uniref:phosphate/phosphite/phosphonate ABC transporter substrate-binding protein n=1 Tax=Polynucleobacter necessarius TaxID=576610 RepID=UPI000E09342A|nr:phosphate/phosphite/phosphonate ABC transporter substrate-binding protein [Polynucleobacter necessarius]